MRYMQGKIRTLLAQQSGQIQLLIIAPILTLSFLSLVVRTANSAIDPSLEKKKVNQQLKQRILEVRGADPQRLPDVEARVQAPPPPGSWRMVTEQSPLSFSLTPLAVETEDKKLSRAHASEKRSDTWEIVQGNNFNPALLAYDPTTTPDKKKPALVKIDNPDEIKKAIANTQAKKPGQSPVVTAALAPVPLPAPAPVKEEVIPFPPAQVIHTIKKQETLEKIFKRIGIPSKEAAKWLSAAKKNDAFRNLRPKQTLELNFREDSFNLQSVVYEIEPDTRAILERKAKDRVNARLEEPPVQPVLLVLGGQVNASLTKTLRKSGLPARMTAGVAALAWDVDLANLRKGDSFKVLLEAVRKGEKIVTYKRVLAAEVTHDEVTYAAFSIPEERILRKKKAVALRYKGEGLNIESDGEKFLQFPLEFTRVSSMFAASRFHPILHRSRAHRGIDFAAPRGTPVYSVASGIVTFAARQSGYGNLVKIDHPGPYETGYAHLQDYADGILEGAAVERGQVIGSVGSTGLATGPHLHFELYKDGEFVNPFGESAVETASATEAIEEEPPVVVDPIIEKKKERLAEQLATLEIGGQQLTSLVIPLQEGPAATGIAAQRTDRPMAYGK
jgi:murein DD-endopeptidase MepM/ murein hydrolase activator NlpD